MTCCNHQHIETPTVMKKAQTANHLSIIGAFTVLLLSLSYCATVLAAISGVCSDCHTMHNSQDNAPMNFDNSTTPNESLTRGDCYGCHAQGGSTPTVTVGTSIIPQVLHSSTNHLAAGNFGYITGLAGSGAADSKGHNIGTLTGTDDVLAGPPGDAVHNGLWISDALRCSDRKGCHGYRAYGSSGVSTWKVRGITGAHHKNVDGQLDQATDPGNSYRFLMGVRGYESADWEEFATPSNHNEYFAIAEPRDFGCRATSCHYGPGGLLQPIDHTISQFCGSCHGNFHTLGKIGANMDGIGGDAVSPFIRHPTDLSLPANSEYAAYTSYKLDAPVARLVVPAVSSSVVTPGSDAVMCLSCHMAHASDYPDMLRWDYEDMIAGAGGAASDTGCFACHTTKD
jgi:predicted CXXCH cytochrome family protein